MVNVILAVESDFSFFYDIKKNKDNMYWTGHTTKPEYDNLKKIFIRTLENHNDVYSRKIFVIRNEGYRCGYLYFDPIDNESGAISIAVIDKYSGKGIGKAALNELIEIVKSKGYKLFIAEIREDNVRSKKMFTTIGFNETEHFRLMRIENIEKEIRMIKFVKAL